MNLSNLKVNQTKTTDTGVQVSKNDGGQYVLVRDGQNAILWHDKAEKAWFLSVAAPTSETFRLEGETAKTVIAAAVTRWEVETTVAPEPGAVELVKDEELEDGTEDTADEVTTLDWEVDTRGGHTTHRAAALAAVAYAMGGEVEFSQQDGSGYRGTALLHVLAPTEVVEALELMLPLVEDKMEKGAAALSRTVSSQARAAGQHHSIHGCHARRGYILGFGRGLAEKILKSDGAKAEVELPEVVKVHMYTEAAYELGYEAATVDSVSA